MEKFIELTDGIRLQIINEKQYNKLHELFSINENANLVVPLTDGKTGNIVHCFTNKEILNGKTRKYLLPFVNYKIFNVRSEDRIINTFGFWNYELNKYEIDGGHSDYHYDAVSSIKSAIKMIEESKYFIIVILKEDE